MSKLRASLPMYDWPEVTRQTDLLWSRLRSRLVDAMPNAPQQLDRSNATCSSHYRTLIFSQTCGYPLVHELPQEIKLVTTPDYAVDHMQNGHYASVILVGIEDHRTRIDDFRHATVAVNSTNSQSGYNCLKNHKTIKHTAQSTRQAFFQHTLLSGSHRQSIRCVATGQADICACDPVSWALAMRHEPAAGQLRILATTTPTPALPLVFSPATTPTDYSVQNWQKRLKFAWLEACDHVEIRRELFLCGASDIDRTAYAAVDALDVALGGTIGNCEAGNDPAHGN